MTELDFEKILLFSEMLNGLQSLKNLEKENETKNNDPTYYKPKNIEKILTEIFKDNYEKLTDIDKVKWDKISEAWPGEPSFEMIRTDIFCESVLIYLYGKGFSKLSSGSTWEEALEEAKGGANSSKWKLNNLKSVATDITRDNINPSDDIEYLRNKSVWGIEEAEMAYLLGLNTDYVNTIERNYVWDFILLYQDCLAVVNGERSELGIFFKRIYNRKENSQKIKSILRLALVRQLDLETK